ncbi:hypothetical protein R3Q08_26295 [Rhodococcus erythropolis]|uniref:hypothetical protein n=1 Tax=Rhodococcus erythropolis TaxID=1833 RepID=UPI002948C4F4|nr:hypothetical protein [Rhodococcus erythropolis]MDV6211781.1 hypothetical protein [Rhodococcus erythropolis]
MKENNKITRDIKAFRRRIKMSPKRVWVLVEGKTHDRTFYENILERTLDLPSSRFEVRLSEQVSADGVAAGGKPHVIKLFNIMRENDWLEQENRRGKVSTIFFLDKDVDDFQSKTISDPHVIYTKNADVEAEIFHYCDLNQAISISHGIGKGPSGRVLAGSETVPERLAAHWENWIRLRLLAIACEFSGSARFGQPSHLHEASFGKLIPDTEEEIRDNIRRSCASEETWLAANDRVDEFIAELKSDNRFSSLVSGKHLAHYLIHLTELALKDVVVRTRITAQEVTISCFANLNFEDDWSKYYQSKLENVLGIGIAEKEKVS